MRGLTASSRDSTRIPETAAAYEWHRRPSGFTGPCPLCGFPRKIGEHRAVQAKENLAARWLVRRKSPRGWQIGSVFAAEAEDEPKKATAQASECDAGQPKSERRRVNGNGSTKVQTDELRRVTQELKRQSAKIQELQRLADGPAQKARTKMRLGEQASLPLANTAQVMGKAAYLVALGKSEPEACKELGIGERAIAYYKTRWSHAWESLVDRAAESALASFRAMAGTEKILANPDAYMAQATFLDDWSAKKGVELFPHGDEEVTLTEFYANWYLTQRLFEARERSKEAYMTALHKWRLITGDPPVKEITPQTIALFREVLMKSRGRKPYLRMSPNSVRCYMRHVQILIDKLGRPGRGNRDGLGILENVPWAKPPREVERIPETVPMEHLSACLMASVAMEWPIVPGVKPPQWWRSLLIVDWNTGLRICTLLTMRMEEIDWQGSRLVLPAARMKSRRPQIVPLNAAAMEALRLIRGERDLVFPTSNNNRCMVHKQFHELQAAAGIPEKDHFGFHTIRKTVATLLWEINPGAAQYALGHATVDVTRKHYVDGGSLVARALDKMPRLNPFPWQSSPSAAEEAAEPVAETAAKVATIWSPPAPLTTPTPRFAAAQIDRLASPPRRMPMPAMG